MQNGLKSILDLNQKIDKFKKKKPNANSRKILKPLSRMDSAPMARNKNYSIDKFLDLS